MKKTTLITLFGFVIFFYGYSQENKVFNNLIKYPYSASEQRRDIIFDNMNKLKSGISNKEVLELLTLPDEINKTYHSCATAEDAGFSYVYLIERNQTDGSVNDKAEKLIRIYFNTNGTLISAYAIRIPEFIEIEKVTINKLFYLKQKTIEFKEIQTICEQYIEKNIAVTEHNGTAFCSCELLGIENNNIYLWIYCEEYYLKNNQLKKGSGLFEPISLKFDENNKVISHSLPQEGIGYTNDIKKIFPEHIIKREDLIGYPSEEFPIRYDKRGKRLGEKNLLKAKEYYKFIIKKK